MHAQSPQRDQKAKTQVTTSSAAWGSATSWHNKNNTRLRDERERLSDEHERERLSDKRPQELSQLITKEMAAIDQARVPSGAAADSGAQSPPLPQMAAAFDTLMDTRARGRRSSNPDQS